VEKQAESYPRRACEAHIKGTILNPIQFRDLAEPGVSEVWIGLEGKLYRLQVTKQGKLILTK
jgi:hemin uptake protein HemP